jgi:hypothetical protein
MRLAHLRDRLIDKTSFLKNLENELKIQVRLSHECDTLIDETSSLKDLKCGWNIQGVKKARSLQL